jgi:hypothetical protein
MDPEQQREWRRLEEQARAILELPPVRTGLTPECHAVAIPSFEDCCSYTLLMPGADIGAPRGVRRVWRRHDDSAKLESPVVRLAHPRELQPMIEERESELPASRALDFLAHAAATPVIVRQAPAAFGVDGTTSILSFGHHFVATRFRWWSKPPAGWEVLEDLLREITSLIETELARR